MTFMHISGEVSGVWRAEEPHAGADDPVTGQPE